MCFRGQVVSGVCSSGPQASCPAALQSLSSCWCELQVDPWEAVAAAVWGLISQAASCAEESLLSQPSPRCGWLHLTGRSANLEMTAMTRTLPHAHGSGWRWGCPLPFTPGDGDAGSFPKAPAWAAAVLRAVGSSPLPSHSPLSCAPPTNNPPYGPEHWLVHPTRVPTLQRLKHTCLSYPCVLRAQSSTFARKGCIRTSGKCSWMLAQTWPPRVWSCSPHMRAAPSVESKTEGVSLL